MDSIAYTDVWCHLRCPGDQALPPAVIPKGHGTPAGPLSQIPSLGWPFMYSRTSHIPGHLCLASKLHLTPYRHPTPGYWELHQSSLEVSSCVSFTSSELQGPVRMQYTAAASSSATRYLLSCRLWVLQEKTVANSPAVSSSRASHGLLQLHISIHRAWTNAGAFSTAHCPSAQWHPCLGQARFEQGLNKLPSYLQVCSHGMMQCQMDVHISCRQKEACRYPISWADIQSSGTLHTFLSASCCCD